MKKIVIPGDKIADKVLQVPHSYTEDGATYATVLGYLDEGRYTPLEGRYKPALGDIVVGIVIDSRRVGYSVDIHLSSSAFVAGRDLRTKLNLGDIISGKIRETDELGNVDLSDVGKLTPGKIIEFPSAKIPRLIGRKSSMLNLIRDNIGGDITVGNNGYVWVSEGSNIPLAIKTLNLIKSKAHLSGLTDEVAEFLQKEKAKTGE